MPGLRDEFLSLRQFAAEIGISYPTAMKWKQANPPKMKLVWVGARQMIPKGEVERFLKEGNINEQPQPQQHSHTG